MLTRRKFFKLTAAGVLSGCIAEPRKAEAKQIDPDAVFHAAFEKARTGPLLEHQLVQIIDQFYADRWNSIPPDLRTVMDAQVNRLYQKMQVQLA